MAKFANLGASSMRRRRTLEDEDPLSGLANLSDCMLVLACGLMVALVVAWNIDIQSVTEIQATDHKTEVTDVQNLDGNFESGGTTYVDVGHVYQDPETGTYYVLDSDIDGAAAAAEGAAGGETQQDAAGETAESA